MRFFRMLLLSVLFLVASCCASSATIISTTYTGTYTASWYGNYNPITHEFPPGGVGSGFIGSGAFEVNFQFDTSHPRAIVTPNRIETSDPSPPYYPPAPGPGTSAWGDFWSGGDYTVASGHIRSTLIFADPTLGSYGTIITLSFEGSSLKLPSDIFTPVTIDDFAGTGSYVSSYGSRGDGGGYITYDFNAETLKIVVDGVSSPITAVPEPSTWALLLVAFFGVAGLRFHQAKLSPGRSDQR